jgi:hypothetical protein
MPQSNFSPQQPNDPENSSMAILVKYKTVIESLQKLLLYGENLRNINKDAINAFERDLREVIQGVEELRQTTDISQHLTSVDAVQENVRSAINELYIALDVIERQDTEIESTRRSFYTCLINCRRYLTQALKLFWGLEQFGA